MTESQEFAGQPGKPLNPLVPDFELGDEEFATRSVQQSELVFTRPQWSVRWIRSKEALAEAVELIKQEKIIGLDTETYDYQRGKEKLALIQIGLPGKNQVLLVDSLALPDISALKEVMEDPSILKAIHSSSFEERQFKREKIKLDGIVDTLSLAKELRPDLPHHTLRACCREFLGEAISKEAQTSDWSTRPLSNEQVEYAALDAEIVVRLCAELMNLSERAAVPVGVSIDEIFNELNSTSRDRLNLIKSFGDEFAVLSLREKRLTEALKEQLRRGEKPYDGPLGAASLSPAKSTEIQPELLRQELPAIAEQVIYESVDREELKKLLKEHGIPEEILDKISKVTGYSYRMSITLKEFQ